MDEVFCIRKTHAKYNARRKYYTIRLHYYNSRTKQKASSSKRIPVSLHKSLHREIIASSLEKLKSCLLSYWQKEDQSVRDEVIKMIIDEFKNLMDAEGPIICEIKKLNEISSEYIHDTLFYKLFYKKKSDDYLRIYILHRWDDDVVILRLPNDTENLRRYYAYTKIGIGVLEKAINITRTAIKGMRDKNDIEDARACLSILSEILSLRKMLSRIET